MLTSSQIRQQFIDFFVKQHGHTFVPSSSVVPFDDPTLLFTNAGMNQFKPIFLGAENRSYKRAANTQKCIRAGGKHNDLDDVGKDTYHHTFFEMLGNWSFGDYFKKEAIRWAWQLLTEVWKLDKTRLHATVFEGSPDEGVPRDDEAADLWKSETDINPTHIHWGNKKDNFWEMGETGPCGPCSEIHVDRTPGKTGGPLVNKGTPDVIEIWNLVFIQFNRAEDRKLTPLPAKHVDTGMGFERVTAVIQNKASNYDTDIFAPLFESIRKVTNAKPYSGKLEDLNDTAYRVIADHIRTLTFALTDGATIGNEGRNYVLRRILRRAERYGRQYFGTTGPFLCDLVPTVVETMGSVFSELKRKPADVAAMIREDEISFIRTLDRGITLFKDAAERARKNSKGVLSGEDVFKLHDTYGLYVDITEQMAGEEGLKVDRAGYEGAMEEARKKARESRKKLVITAVSGDVPRTDDSPKYETRQCDATVIGWIKNNAIITSGRLEAGDEVALLLDRTPFYGEQGGQVGDTGTIETRTGWFCVEDTQKLGDTVLHLGRVSSQREDGEPRVECGQAAYPMVDERRRLDIMRNHTATHLLNWALRKVLHSDIDQKGSLVDDQKTRFDFSYNEPLNEGQIAAVERMVNERLFGDLPVCPVTMPLAEAKKIPGVRAAFGEKYPDPVRVLLIGPEKPADVTSEDSVEFCGGTHLNHTGQAGFFKIISQELVAKGVRRVTAVTGPRAVEVVQHMAAVLQNLSGRFNCKPEDVPSRIEAMQDEIKKLQAQLKKGTSGDLQSTGDRLLAEAIDCNGARIITGVMPAAPADQIRQQVDRLRQKAGSCVIVLGWTEDDKVSLLASVTEDLIAKGANAGKLIGEVAKTVGGKGGGKPNMAQAGGKDAAKLPEAMVQARELAKQQLGA